MVFYNSKPKKPLVISFSASNHYSVAFNHLSSLKMREIENVLKKLKTVLLYQKRLDAVQSFRN